MNISRRKYFEKIGGDYELFALKAFREGFHVAENVCGREVTGKLGSSICQLIVRHFRERGINEVSLEKYSSENFLSRNLGLNFTSIQIDIVGKQKNDILELTPRAIPITKRDTFENFEIVFTLSESGMQAFGNHDKEIPITPTNNHNHKPKIVAEICQLADPSHYAAKLWQLEKDAVFFRLKDIVTRTAKGKITSSVSALVLIFPTNTNAVRIIQEILQKNSKELQIVSNYAKAGRLFLVQQETINILIEGLDKRVNRLEENLDQGLKHIYNELLLVNRPWWRKLFG